MLYVSDLPPNCTADDVVRSCGVFGRVNKSTLLPGGGAVLIEMESEATAKTIISFAQTAPLRVNDYRVRIGYAKSRTVIPKGGGAVGGADADRRYAPPSDADRRYGPPADHERRYAPPADLDRRYAPPVEVDRRYGPPPERHYAPPPPPPPPPTDPYYAQPSAYDAERHERARPSEPVLSRGSAGLLRAAPTATEMVHRPIRRVLFFLIEQALYPISTDVLYQIVSPRGNVLRIIVYDGKFPGSVNALVEVSDVPAQETSGMHTRVTPPPPPPRRWKTSPRLSP